MFTQPFRVTPFQAHVAVAAARVKMWHKFGRTNIQKDGAPPSERGCVCGVRQVAGQKGHVALDILDNLADISLGTPGWVTKLDKKEVMQCIVLHQCCYGMQTV